MGTAQQLLIYGAAAAAAGVTWDPAFGGANATFSNGNLTVTTAGAPAGSLRSTTSHNSGKYYFEVLATTVNTGSNSPTIGVVNWAVDATGVIQNGQAGAWGIQSSPAFDYGNGSYHASGATFANGDVFCFALDCGAGKVWFGKNGTWLHSGNPAAGTGASWSNVTIGANLYATVGRIGSATAVTARFASASWGFTAPSGFGPW